MKTLNINTISEIYFCIGFNGNYIYFEFMSVKNNVWVQKTECQNCSFVYFFLFLNRVSKT